MTLQDPLRLQLQRLDMTVSQSQPVNSLPLEDALRGELPEASGSKKRILAIASGGGHWVQLLRLRPILERNDVIYVTVDKGYRKDVAGHRLHVVRDANLWNKGWLTIQMFQVFGLILWYRPGIVLSTGAAPGYFALRFGKLFGAETIWIDSIANSEKLSLSGKHVGKYADLWLTQWEHLAEDEGSPDYGGSIL